MNICAFLDQTAARHARLPAVMHGDRLYADFATLRARALALAGTMSAAAQPGDRVLIAARNCPEYVELMFGTWAAGLAVVPVNAKLHPDEIGQIIRDATPRWIFGSDDVVRGLGTAHPAIEIGAERYRSMLAGDATTVARDPHDLAWLFYTSGTTGKPKGAMLTHRNLIALSIAHLADFDNADSACSLVHGAPMSHGSGLYIPAYVLRGARQVVPVSGGFDVAEFFDLMERHPGASAFLAPTMLNRLRAESSRRGGPPRNLRTIFYGGGPMHLEDLKEAKTTFGETLVQLYGQGEAPMTISGLTRTDHATSDDAVLSSVGWPRSGVEIRIADARNRPLPIGQTGEILCRGDIVMAGYWGNAGASGEALLGGWLHTGDMGSIDEDGKLTLKDRSKDVIISGGSNIYPREVEDVLLGFPGVVEASVVGASDPEWGEIVVAFIVANDDVVIDQAELDRFCTDRIARFKRPKRYVQLAALPKSNYGKVLKRELKTLL